MFCKHCGHSSKEVFAEDQWGFLVCPVCEGDEVISYDDIDIYEPKSSEAVIKDKDTFKKVGNLIIPIIT